jgi:hypothetical protein
VAVAVAAVLLLLQVALVAVAVVLLLLQVAVAVAVAVVLLLLQVALMQQHAEFSQAVCLVLVLHSETQMLQTTTTVMTQVTARQAERPHRLIAAKRSHLQKVQGAHLEGGLQEEHPNVHNHEGPL